MTAIDRLLRQAGELNAAGMKELSPAIEEMASVQAGVADALEPILEAMASVAGAQPFRYGFVLPAEPPGFKPDQAEPVPASGKAEVNLGPINVYTIAGEIQKALSSVGQDSANLQGVFSTYVPRQTALPPIAPPGVEGSQRQPPVPLQPEKRERPDRLRFEQKLPSHTASARKATTEEWVEESIKRSGVVLEDLREVQENIISSTITKEKVQALSVEALAIGQAAAMGSAPPRLPEKPQNEEEPVRPAFTYTPPVMAKPRPPGESSQTVRQETRNTVQAQPPEKPATPGSIPTAPASEAREPALPGTVKAPTIRLRASPVVVPAQDADFNARSLSRARSMDAENRRPLPEAGPARLEKEERPVKVEWPVITTGSPDRLSLPVAQHGEAPRQAWSGPAQGQETGHSRAGSAGTPVVQVIRSFGAMGEALRAVSEIGASASFSLPAAVVPPITEAGAPILNAMAGAAPVARPESQEIGRLAAAANMSSAQPVAAPVTQAGGSSSPAVVFLAGTGTQALRPAWGLAANISAAQASQRAGVAMIQRLVQAAPQVAGSVAPQAPTIYDGGRGLPFQGMITPAAASGAENIVNVTVPNQASQSKVSETNTTTRVANFHNTFNITVNLQSAEERDLKDLGKKIGQLLSEELKRYGGLS